MKVLHLSTSSIGGAGLAALRTHEALVACGVSSEILFSEDFDNISNSPRVLLAKSSTVIQRHVVQKGSEIMTPISINRLRVKSDPTSLIHIHNFYNLISPKQILELLDNQLVFITTHDQRLLTGGCHVIGVCSRFDQMCSKCPRTRLAFRSLIETSRTQTQQILHHPNIRIICPSKWMKNHFTVHQKVSPSQVHLVRNPIPKSSRQVDSSSLKKQIGLGDAEVVVGFISMNLNSPIKGLTTLWSAFERMSRKQRARFGLILVGDGSFPHVPQGLQICHISAKQLSKHKHFFHAIDVTVVPSTFDNIPNVIGEAMMSGSAVIGSRTGGITEVLEDFQMLTFDPADADNLKSVLVQWVRSVPRHEIIQRAQNYFGYEVVGRQLQDVYLSAE